jgi:hypothetical protein
VGLDDRRKPGRPAQVDEVAVVLATLEAPPERLGLTHWSSRLLGHQLGISNVRVADLAQVGRRALDRLERLERTSEVPLPCLPQSRRLHARRKPPSGGSLLLAIERVQLLRVVVGDVLFFESLPFGYLRLQPSFLLGIPLICCYRGAGGISYYVHLHSRLLYSCVIDTKCDSIRSDDRHIEAIPSRIDEQIYV